MIEETPKRNYYYSAAKKERAELRAQLEKESLVEPSSKHNQLDSNGHFKNLCALNNALCSVLKIYKLYLVDCIQKMEHPVDFKEFYRLRKNAGHKKISALEIYLRYCKEPIPKNTPKT